jgi:hypothetical protein
VLPWPESTTKYINGVGIRPGNKAMVHHAVLNLAEPEAVEIYTKKDAEDPGPGYTCFTAMATAINAEARASLIGAFEKPEPGQLFPNGTGMRVKPGSAVILQVHYNTLATGAAEEDRSIVEFSTVDEVDNPVRSRFATDIRWALVPDTMHIPAGEPDAWVSAEMSPAGVAGQPEFDVYWADLHMHTLGTRGELSVLRADGTKECLLRIDQWRFQWQQTFFLKQPTRIREGDKLYLECHWGNTPERQYRANGEVLPVQDVHWGDGSRDEMCLGNFLVTEPPPPAPPPDASTAGDGGPDAAPADAAAD